VIKRSYLRLLVAAAVIIAIVFAVHTGNDNLREIAHSAPTSLQSVTKLAGVSHGERAMFGSLPDQGQLTSYVSPEPAHRDGAYTWHRAAISEEHALRAVVSGRLRVTTPAGEVLDFDYVRHVEHFSGDWTWIGQLHDGPPSEQVILTFGEKAAFGVIAQPGRPDLRLITQAGSAWLVETDPKRIAGINNAATRPSRTDAPVPPRRFTARPVGGAPQTTAASTTTAAATASTSNVVDLVVGYTTGFATGLGGSSQAVTRLHNMIDITNEAYLNSQVDARVRLVATVQVNYPDNTSNDDTLEKLTGYSSDSGSIAVDPAFNALRAARDQYGADLVSLVRKFRDPENDGCGIAWLIGSDRSGISTADSDFGYSVVSDGRDTGSDGKTYFCREETFAHELGHNMGSQHDKETATTDGKLSYGAYTYSFGYKTTPLGGNFYTVMAYGDDGQDSYRIFSNPRTTFCGGYACGVTNVADNARSLSQTVATIAQFRPTQAADDPPPVPSRARNDIDGNGKSDFLWRGNTSSDNFVMWFMNGATRGITRSTSLSTSYRVVATGDFNGDNKLDVVWRAGGATRLRMWLGNGAGGFTGYWIESEFGPGWEVVGTGDLNGNGKTDLLWRGSGASDNFVMWFMNGPSIARVRTTSLSSSYRVVATGDFNGDERLDVVWRSGDATRLRLWQGDGTGGFDGYWIESQLGAGWDVVGAGDLNGNGKTDLLWRGSGSTDNVVFWFMSGPTIARTRARTMSTSYHLEALGDFNGDERLDMVWRAGEATRVRMWLGDGLGAFNGYWIEPTFGAGWQLVP
jgi:peptidyl-Asp metalloendopeptidase